jgi:hypothetical protein
MRTGLSLKLPSPMLVSSPVLPLLLDGAKNSLMHFRPAICVCSCGGGDPKTCQQYLKRAILKILVKKTLIEIFLSGILVLNGNWPVGQIR